MLYRDDLFIVDAQRQLIRDAYRADETKVIHSLLAQDTLSAVHRGNIWQRARELVVYIRQQQQGKGGVDALLQEFSLSSSEGIVLMCLAEALLRVPDKHTMDQLIRDKLAGGDWEHHLGNSD
jgi:RHH-type proline utilization regulon transcriptional repressor/proline dehydrogenase/delta 1-pyrroline-5-carboxylate dehydrogenase